MSSSIKDYFFNLLKVKNIDTSTLENIWKQRPANKNEKESLKWLIDQFLQNESVDKNTFGLAVQEFYTKLAEYETSRKTISQNNEKSNVAIKHFAKYKIIKELGSGNMGRVLLVHDPDKNMQMALKIMLAGEHAGEEQENRFFKETSAMQRLQHPNIVQIHDVGRHNNINFFTMEYLEGDDLETFLEKRKVSSRRAVEIFIKVAQAIQHAHEKNILHRDIKPGNIIMRNDKEPVVTDFGLARSTREASRITQTGALIGTPAYMAPEQARGKVKDIDERTDIYALGITLYKILTQQLPFNAATPLATLHKVVNSPPTPVRKINPLIPQDLENICMKAIAKSKKDRFNTARKMVDELQRFLDGVSTNTAQASSRFVNFKFWANKYKTYILLTVLLLFSVTGNVYALLKSNTLVENTLKQSIQIISPNFLKKGSSDAIPSVKGKIALKVSLPMGITEIHTTKQRISWDRKKTNFTLDIPLSYGANTIEVIFFSASGQYYKLRRNVLRAKPQNSVFFHGNLQRLYKAKPHSPTPLKLNWQFPVKNTRITFSPLVLGKRILFGCRNGFFYCIDDSGNFLWKFKSSATIKGYGAIYNGVVYFGNVNGDVYGLDIYSGKKLFYYNVIQPQRFSPIIVDDVIYINTEKNLLFAVDLKTSKKKWRFKGDKGDELYSSPALYKDLIILSEYNDTVYALNRSNGNIVWQKTVAAHSYNSPIVIDDKVYVTVHGKFYAFDAQTGKELWDCELQGRFYSTGVYYQNMIVVINRRGVLQAVDLKKHKVKWNLKTSPPMVTKKNQVLSSLIIAGDDVFIHSVEAFYSFNIKTKQKTIYHQIPESTKHSDNYSTPKIYGTSLYITTIDGFLKAYHTKK
ncbi:serine/threonine-protein kinase [Candidatus Uabimicrobium amorphum]|uniref:non-specific serine/threonine protein kinase n=1 Tax=Uabimicrobium amorphum TaxID=2596890 RepID=A0A5S9IRE0_UABAM|nr:serine/threonine-protein kinase [Candidatus Uabimicrobium amorphum]BBM85305.1 protein kinase [Candidatus Uabimicrobium amorphum]